MKAKPHGIKLEINDKKKFRKFTDMWKLSNNSEITAEITHTQKENKTIQNKKIKKKSQGKLENNLK